MFWISLAFLVCLALIQWSDQVTQEIDDLVLIDEGDDLFEDPYKVLVENHPQREAGVVDICVQHSANLVQIDAEDLFEILA